MSLSKRFAFLFTVCCAIAQSAKAQTAADYQKRFAALASASGLSDSARFNQLLDLDWEYSNVMFPESATFNGYPGQNDRWTDLSLPSIRAQRAMIRTELNTVRAIDRTRLRPADQLSYDLFKRGLDEALEGQRFPTELMPVDQRNGPQYLAATL